MMPIDLCEQCGKPEKGYLVTKTNAKLRQVAKGPAARQIESFLCSRCVQLGLKRETPGNGAKKVQAEKS